MDYNIYQVLFVITLFLSGFGFGAGTIMIFVDKITMEEVSINSKKVMVGSVIMFLLSLFCYFIITSIK